MERRNKGQRKCKYGLACRDLRKGSCSFPHDPEDYEKVKLMPASIFKKSQPFEKNSRKNPTQDQMQLKEKESIYISPTTAQHLASLDLEALLEELSKIHLQLALEKTEFKHPMPFMDLIRVLDTLVEGRENFVARERILGFLLSDFFDKLKKEVLKEFVDLKLGRMTQDEKVYHLLKLCSSLLEMMDLAKTYIDKLPISELSDVAEEYQLHIESGNNIISEGSMSELELAVNSLKKKKKILQMERIIQKNKEAEEEKKQESQPQILDEEYKKDPEADFMEINIIPDQHELQRVKQLFLRKMPDRGDLRNKNNYLDIVFRLLHEDAVRPLRAGLLIYQQCYKSNRSMADLKKFLKQEQVRIYTSLYLSNISLNRNGPALIFTHSVDKKSRVDWRTAKQLMPGSLVLLSCDGFNTCIPALTIQKDAQEMNKTQKAFGYVLIGLDVSLSSLDSITSFFIDQYEREFTILESGAYFVSYHFVLNKLKAMNYWPELPLQDYYINGRAPPEVVPEYIEELEEVSQRSIRNAILKYSLDQSQQAAMLHALTNKVGLIQGPPGTGKTYVGQQIVHFLLQNKAYWKPEGVQGLILIVTYTNHALNQFLRLIKPFTSKILRIGGMLKDPEDQRELSQFNFFEVCRRTKIDKGRQFTITLKDLEKQEELFMKAKADILVVKFGLFSKFMISLKPNLEVIHKNLIVHFKSFLYHHLNNFLPKIPQPHLDITYKYLVARVQGLFATDADFMIPFWLGLANLNAFFQEEMTEFIESVNSGNPLKPDGFDPRTDPFDIWDDEDERDFEYEKLSKEIGGIQSSQQFLQSLFVQGAQDPLFGHQRSFQECVAYGAQIQGTVFIDDVYLKQISRMDFFQLSMIERWTINNYIVQSINLERQIQQSDKTLAEHQRITKMKKDIENQASEVIFQDCDIVAMTTTGCSKYSDLIQGLKFPIVIIEEAAEVFEAHITSSLSQETEHLILIGDHQQLRPNPTIYDLSRTYNLSLSMFERLINNNLPFRTLAHQRRMRPEISAIVKLIYPHLEDHSSVSNRPNIKGVDKNVFFFNHQHQEGEFLNSKQNKFEADMIVKLTLYFLQQQYKPQQITILSLYTGQLLLIRTVMKSTQNLDLKDVKVCTVDNYQGEENEIILLSLTRSNPQNNVGFLKIHNRVCVALSRAKNGLFIFGNSSCLLNYKKNEQEYQSDLWKNIIDYLKSQEFFGSELILKCQNHSAVAKVQCAEDFKNVPEGGCLKICGVRKMCGHSCKNFCHPYEKSLSDPDGHKKWRCPDICDRKRNDCEHSCQKSCYRCSEKGCPPCDVTIQLQMFPCMHYQKTECNKKNQNQKCYNDCEKYLKCGHQCQARCYIDCETRACRVQVQVQLPCKHVIDADCSKTIFQLVQEKACFKPCPEILECGHSCPLKCGECQVAEKHGKCTKKCDRSQVCGHQCSLPCSKNCPPCNKKCNTECEHSRCPQPCMKVCVPCKEPCQNKCAHSKCTRKCYEPCNKQICNERCKKIRKCGHQCIGLCGELCPELCKLCHSKHEAFQIFLGYEEEDDALFIQIDCKHIFEVRGLDYHMQMQDNQNPNAVMFKRCPRCRQFIMKCKRYQDHINQTLNDINFIKKKILETEEQNAQNLTQLEKNIEESLQEVKEFVIQNEFSSQLPNLGFNLKKEIKKITKEREFEKIPGLAQQLEVLDCFKVLLTAHFMIQTQGSSSSSQLIDIERILKLIIKNNLKFEAAYFKSLIQVTKTYRDKYAKDMKKLAVEYLLKATGLSSDHWFKCPNGHFYVIGECGGAMEQSKCPDCDHVIGGGGHALAHGNAHAREFGGHNAWDPEGFNARIQRGEVNLEDVAHD